MSKKKPNREQCVVEFARQAWDANHDQFLFESSQTEIIKDQRQRFFIIGFYQGFLNYPIMQEFLKDNPGNRWENMSEPKGDDQ